MNNIFLIMAGFLAVPLTIAIVYGVIMTIKREKTEKEEKTVLAQKKKKGGLGWLVLPLSLVAVLLIVGVMYYNTYTAPTKQGVATTKPQWQICWEKKPEYRGESGIRTRCLPAKILRRSEGYIIISYSFPGGRGVQEGTSIDGINYDGKWKDSTGWGKFHLRFVSPDTAFGWSDDKGRGYKQPNVLAKK
ncbi:MAG: hypothetical protein GXP44_00255 [bacterium]|nr:hypothetical protein [bacterium]